MLAVRSPMTVLLAAAASCAALAAPARAELSGDALEVAARAESAPAEEAGAPAEASPRASAMRKLPSWAFGMNTPVGWARRSIGASLYVGVSQHFAVRVNAATYDYEMSPLDWPGRALAGIRPGSAEGTVRDFGAGWVYFPRRLWQGFLLEAGALQRTRIAALRSHDGDADPSQVDSTTYALRGAAGWSWRMRSLFLSVAAGLSVGRETGTEVIFRASSGMPERTRIDRLQLDGEYYLRLGFAFGG